MASETEILRILLVDHGDDVLSDLASALAVDDPDSERFQLDKVDGCEEALDELIAGGFDLVLIADPVADVAGIEVLQDILRSGYSAPVVLVTKRDDRPTQEAALAAGATDYAERGRLSADLMARLVRYGRDYGRLLRLLTHTRRCYRAAVRRDAGGTFAWDLSSRLIRFDPGFKAQLGYTDDELPDDPDAWFNRLLPADRPRLRQAIKLLVSGAVPSLTLELRVQRRDASYLWVRVEAILKRDQEGRSRIVGSQTDIHASKQAEERVAWAERHDPLTGLLRRAAFVDALDRHIAALTEADDGGVLCLCDVDGLKAINNRHGRDAGDEALLWLAGLLEDRLGADAQVARLTGDKFAFLLGDAQLAAAVDLVEAMQVELSAEVFITPAGEEFCFTVSFALAPRAAIIEDATRWIDLADLRLVDAQRLGRPLVVLQPEMVSSALTETRPIPRASLRPRRRQTQQISKK